MPTRCYVGFWNGQLVAFGASMTMPNGYIKNAWRGHRTVILPDFQGMGIGVRFSDAIAQIHIDQGLRYFLGLPILGWGIIESFRLEANI